MSQDPVGVPFLQWCAVTRNCETGKLLPPLCCWSSECFLTAEMKPEHPPLFSQVVFMFLEKDCDKTSKYFTVFIFHSGFIQNFSLTGQSSVQGGSTENNSTMAPIAASAFRQCGSDSPSFAALQPPQPQLHLILHLKQIHTPPPPDIMRMSGKSQDT